MQRGISTGARACGWRWLRAWGSAWARRSAPWCAALVVSLAAPGCNNAGTQNGSVSGASFPPLAGATIQALDVTDRDYVTTPGLVLVEGASDAAGAFVRLPLGKFSGAMVVRSVGGSYLEPATASQVTLSSAINGGVPEAEYDALVPQTPRVDYKDLVISPLSDLAAALALGTAIHTGASRVDAARAANRAVSLYFTDDPGFVPFTRGAVLWDPAAPLAVTPSAITNDIKLGLIVAGLSVRANLRGIDLQSYAAELFRDALDGTLDGILHPPASASVTFTAAIASYPSDPLGATLAADIEAFLNGPTNESGLTPADVQPLLSQIRAGESVLSPDVPRIEAVLGPQAPGDRAVQIRGARFVQGARVQLDGQPVDFVDVLGFDRIRFELPPGFVSGAEVFVTVVNPDGLRSSVRVTINVP